MTERSPHVAAERLITEAPDRAWLRALADDLDGGYGPIRWSSCWRSGACRRAKLRGRSA